MIERTYCEDCHHEHVVWTRFKHPTVECCAACKSGNIEKSFPDESVYPELMGAAGLVIASFCGRCGERYPVGSAHYCGQRPKV